MRGAGEAEPEGGPHTHGTGLDPHHPYHVAHRGYSVLITRQDGSIDATGPEGLLDYDTRILSRHELSLGGEVLRDACSTVLAADQWVCRMRLPRAGGSAAGPELPQDQVGIVISRLIGRGMREEITVSNHAMVPFQADLELELEADFADAQELRGRRQQHGRVQVRWSAAEQRLVFDYDIARDGRRLQRAMAVQVVQTDSAPSADGNKLRFDLALAPRATWRAVLDYESQVDGVWRRPSATRGGPGEGHEAYLRAQTRWRRACTHLQCSNHVVESAFERAASDLFELRNFELDVGEDAWVPNAGIPMYTGLFGRDVLTASWQAALLGPELMRGALARIADTQIDVDDPWRDAEPGKLIHEMRRGPLSDLEIIPQRAYYGTQTTCAMFTFVLSELWHWTGDRGALAQFRDVALRTFEWARRYGDLDGDGFLEYVRRSPKGLKNHAWKDSDEAIRYPDGSLVENPIATVEEQAYYFVALQRMAEILVALGDDQSATDFLEEARRLRVRWNEAFWMPEERFYALALDKDKQPVRSIASNAGHALAAGLVPSDRARAVADRLLSPELFSGWGVRTLSDRHPSYNPYGYHLGTVWPVENATFALGFKRYGFDDHVERLVTALFQAASFFYRHRLPEVFTGEGPEQVSIPVFYPASNSPQAWSASATIHLVQAMLGLYAFAPAHLLVLVRPRLPAWLERLVVRRVRVGDAVLSLAFHRDAAGKTHVEPFDQKGRLRILIAPPPNVAEDEAGWTDRLKSWLLREAPGRLARQMRIALGLEGG
jgi:glycogen debranching enzyme